MHALARAHELTMPDLAKQNSTTETATTVTALLKAIAAPHEHEQGPHIAITGADAPLRGNALTSLALLLHELTTNAVKHGALSRPGGRIDVGWHVAASEQGKGTQLHLEWRETGGPPVAPPQKKGFGSRLLERSLANELDGSITTIFDHAGLVCLITIPLPAEHVSGEAPGSGVRVGPPATSLTSSPLLPMSG